MPDNIPTVADASRRRRVRRTALLLGGIALAFYVTFITVTIWRATR